MFKLLHQVTAAQKSCKWNSHTPHCGIAPEEKSEVRDFHFRLALLRWSSARFQGLSFQCYGWDTTRTFIVCGQLMSSEEQQLFRADEVEAQWLSCSTQRPLNEQGQMWLLFGRLDYLMSQEVNSILIEDHHYSPRACPYFLWCHQGLETEFWHRHNHTHLCTCTCTYSNRASFHIHPPWMSVNQHHRKFEIIIISNC